MKKWEFLSLGMIFLVGLFSFGYYFIMQYQTHDIYSQAENAYQQKNYTLALDLYKKIKQYNFQSLSLFEQANVYINEGNSLYEMKKYTEAIDFFAKGVEIIEKHGLLNKIEYPLPLYSRWGEGYEVKKEYSNAEQIYLRGITNLEALYGKKYHGVALLQARLGEIYLYNEEDKKSLFYWECVLENVSFMKIQNDADNAMIYRCVSAAYCHNNKLEEALITAKKAIIFASKSYGETSPQVAIIYAGMALIYYKQKNLPEAFNLLDRAYNILVKKCGAKHSATLRIKKLRHEWKSTLHQRE